MTHWGSKLWKYLDNEKGMDIIPRRPYFPCADDTCLVRVSCKQACDKLIMDENKLMDAFLGHNACPDCGSAKFIEGPSGGMATNVRCGRCNHGFNFALPLFIHRINMDANGRFK